MIKKRNGLANIHGGVFTIIIFNLLIYLGLIKTIGLNDLKKLINKSINTKKVNKCKNLKPMLLKVPRSLFIDRIFRFFFS